MATPSKSSSKRSGKARSSVARGSALILRHEVQINHAAFLGAMERAIEFHRTNTNDPHNVGNAVMTALSEVRDCFKAYMC